MQTGLTKNDKRLLVLLINIVLCFFFGYFIIYPNFRMGTKYSEKLIIQESHREINDSKVSNLPVLLMDKESYEEDVVKNSENYYDIMSEADIDKMMTGMALSYGIEPFDLNIDLEKTAASTVPYQYSERAISEEGASAPESDSSSQEEDLLSLGSSSSDTSVVTDTSSSSDRYEKKFRKEFADHYGYNYGSDPSMQSILDDPFAEYDEEVEEEETEAEGSHEIREARISMRLGGDYEKINAFLQSLFETDKELLVRSYSWDEETLIYDAGSLDDADYVANTRKILYLQYSIFMCDR